MFDLHSVPIGIYEKALPDNFSWEQKFLAASTAGYSHIELSIDESDRRLARLNWTNAEAEKLRTLSLQSGIAIPTLCLSAHRRFPFGSKDSGIRNRAMEIMEQAILLAQRLGIRCIQLAAYDVYYEPSDSQTVSLFLEGLHKAVTLAARAGVMLALEIMDTPFVGTISRGLSILEQIRSPYLKLYPDIGNLTQFSDNIFAELHKGIAEIAAIHVKETLPGKFKNVPFGKGTVQFSAIFRCLNELQYSGLFLIEMWANQDDTPASALEQIIRAREFVLDKMHSGGYQILSREG